ncbi:MAG: DEAD/DEAH box helicase, partial [Myxococcales bacterium]
MHAASPSTSSTSSSAPATSADAAPDAPAEVRFDDLGLIEPLRRAVRDEGYTVPTPIQRQAIPLVASGRDVLGVAQTGTGKTAAFALPILQRLAAMEPRKGPEPRVLVLSPTRELALQIDESFKAYGRHLRLTSTVIFGGVGQDSQVQALRRGVDVLVATPGRLLDLMQQGQARLGQLKIFVLDEADRMLDMGFLPDVRRIVAQVPKERQTLFFSATMPDDIVHLANSMLIDPTRVEVTPVASTAERIAQSVYFVEKNAKRGLLLAVLREPSLRRALVFTRTKHGANRVVEHLEKSGVQAAAIHGNKSQNARQRALDGFKTGALRVLVATDIAARGIDIDGISHVVNYELPNVPETYVHRIGRTARAGADGIAISFCEEEERPFLVDIERLIRQHVPRVDEHAFLSPLAPPPLTSLDPTRRHYSAALTARSSLPAPPDGSRPAGGGGGGRPGGGRGQSSGRGGAPGGGQGGRPGGGQQGRPAFNAGSQPGRPAPDQGRPAFDRGGQPGRPAPTQTRPSYDANGGPSNGPAQARGSFQDRSPTSGGSSYSDRGAPSDRGAQGGSSYGDRGGRGDQASGGAFVDLPGGGASFGGGAGGAAPGESFGSSPSDAESRPMLARRPMPGSQGGAAGAGSSYGDRGAFRGGRAALA